MFIHLNAMINLVSSIFNNATVEILDDNSYVRNSNIIASIQFFRFVCQLFRNFTHYFIPVALDELEYLFGCHDIPECCTCDT